MPFLGSGGERELLLLVVSLDKVLDDGARLPEGEAGIGILDGGQAAVGVDLGKGLILGVLDGNLQKGVVRTRLYDCVD